MSETKKDAPSDWDGDKKELTHVMTSLTLVYGANKMLVFDPEAKHATFIYIGNKRYGIVPTVRDV